MTGGAIASGRTLCAGGYLSLAGPLLSRGLAMRLVSVVALLAATAASAQTAITLTLEGQTDPTVPLVKAGNSCADTVRVTYAVPAFGASVCDDLQIWATTGTCGERAGTGDHLIAEISEAELFQAPQGTESFLVSDLPNFTAEQGCPAADVEQTVLVCASLKVFNSLSECNVVVDAQEEPEIIYDSRAPGAPTIQEITPLDGALSVRVAFPEDAQSMFLEYSTSGTGFTRVGPFNTDIGTIQSLENDTEYIVRAIAVDDAGNESAVSAELRGTPVLTRGFFGRYRDAGGLENGGCSSAGGGLSLLGAVIALGAGALRRRRG